jgi:hypothetical protein
VKVEPNEEEVAIARTILRGPVEGSWTAHIARALAVYRDAFMARIGDRQEKANALKKRCAQLERRVAQLGLIKNGESEPAHILAEAERLLREAGVLEVFFFAASVETTGTQNIEATTLAKAWKKAVRG